MLEFPLIPTPLLEVSGIIEPCPEVKRWALGMFVEPGAPLLNPDHQHLNDACIEFVWTNVPYSEKNKRVIGQAQLGYPTGKAWARAAREDQLDLWFGHIPDFIITLDAVYLSTASPAQICALVEHELYHCAIKLDEHGDEMYDKFGAPQWGMRGHDVEQFSGVMARYGPTSIDEDEFVKAAKALPFYGEAVLGGICGSCR
jgi:hypothetical protein